MKPKNRVFCYECQRPKMLFETEKKAQMFIKFNADNIGDGTGKKPTRAYFCEACGGWHITSRKYITTNISKTDEVIEAYNKNKQNRRYIPSESQI